MFRFSLAISLSLLIVAQAVAATADRVLGTASSEVTTATGFSGSGDGIASKEISAIGLAGKDVKLHAHADVIPIEIVPADVFSAPAVGRAEAKNAEKSAVDSPAPKTVNDKPASDNPATTAKPVGVFKAGKTGEVAASPASPSPASPSQAAPPKGGMNDLAVVPFFDGDRSGFLDTWGGQLAAGGQCKIRLQSQQVHSSQLALALDIGKLVAGETRYFQCLASGFGPTRSYLQTRDLTSYSRLEFWVQNATHSPLKGQIKLKDNRDSENERAIFPFAVADNSQWTHVVVPLDTSASKWQCDGHVDLNRILSIDFIFGPSGDAAAGEIYLDNIVFIDRGGSLDVNTAPLPNLVERLAHRQWKAMWAARNREHGLIPNNSYQSTDAGTNTTAAMLWMLPAAIRHHWISQTLADDYVTLLNHTIGHLLDQGHYLPARNVDWVTLKPSLLPEESTVDAAFLALAMHRYKSLPAVSEPLRKSVSATENRFNFAVFGCSTGWRMAYRYPGAHVHEGFTLCTYDGYTNEGNLVSLAAHLAERKHVPIETYWNSSFNRVRLPLGNSERAPVVHSLEEFRAPFSQALLNLFVDVRQRGPDKYPDDRLAVNPWDNFVCYEQSVMGLLSASGRTGLVQPDAGDDGTLTCYRQFSAYHDFGERDLFMPWSVSFALLAQADGADDALRLLLRNRLHGPFGLVDSAKWATGAAKPYAMTARQDFWNTSLSTMAFLEYLDRDDRPSKSFADLPEVRVALDRVFKTVSKKGGSITVSTAATP